MCHWHILAPSAVACDIFHLCASAHPRGAFYRIGRTFLYDNKKLCQKLLEVILNVKISKIEYVKEQVSLTGKPDSKSVRLDVYVSDDAGTVYDVEMQTGNTRNLPKRSRYYQSIIDINLLMKGSGYQSLRKSYVIFICTFDPFGAGRHIFRFENRCLEDD